MTYWWLLWTRCSAKTSCSFPSPEQSPHIPAGSAHGYLSSLSSPDRSYIQYTPCSSSHGNRNLRPRLLWFWWVYQSECHECHVVSSHLVREWRHLDWRWDEWLWLRVHAFSVDCCHYFVQLLSLCFDGRWQVYQSCQSVQQFDVSRSA